MKELKKLKEPELSKKIREKMLDILWCKRELSISDLVDETVKAFTNGGYSVSKWQVFGYAWAPLHDPRVHLTLGYKYRWIGENSQHSWGADEKLLDGIRRELKEFNGPLPTRYCLQPDELSFLSGQSNHTNRFTSQEMADRIKHVVSCEFCLPLAKLALGFAKNRR